MDGTPRKIIDGACGFCAVILDWSAERRLLVVSCMKILTRRLPTTST
jgi:hypothetical protein